MPEQPNSTLAIQSKSKYPIDVKSLLIAAAVVFLIDTGPIQYVILTITGIRVRLDVFAYVVSPLFVFFIQKYMGKVLDSINITIIILLLIMVISAQWSPSIIARDQYLLQLFTIIPVSYLLGLSVAQCHPKYANVLFIGVAAPVYLFYNPDFSDYKFAAESIFNYQPFAQCYAIAAMSTIILLFYTKNKYIQFLLFLFVPLFVFAALKTGGRGGVLGVTVSVGAILLYKYSKQRVLIIATILIVNIVVLLFFDSIMYTIIEYASEYKLLSIERIITKLLDPSEGDAFYSRDKLTESAFRLLLDNPIFGVGLGGFPVAANLGDDPGNYPHNSFLEVLVEQGLVGFSVFMILVWLLVARFLETRKYLSPNHVAYVIGWASLALAKSLTSGHIQTDTQLWVVVGYTVGLSWEATALSERLIARRSARSRGAGQTSS